MHRRGERVRKACEVRCGGGMEAVTDAIRNELDREKQHQAKAGLSDELMEIGRRCAAHMRSPVTDEPLLIKGGDFSRTDVKTKPL